MFNHIFKMFLLVLVVSCSSSNTEISSSKIPFDPSMPKKIILLVPGYYGSMLKEEATGKIRWAKASNFLFSQTGIADVIPGTTIGPNNKLVVTEILRNVRVLPKLWDVDSYQSTLDQLDTFAIANKMHLETVVYDWRDDFGNSLKAIDEKIKSFDLGPKDELYVVAHSQGALLMAYYLRYGAQDVETAKENWDGLRYITKIALVAPPLHGLMILFRDMEDGTCIGLNRSLLSDRDYSTFKSTFFFLPPKGEDIGIGLNNKKASLGIHNIDNWQKNKWGAFKFAKTSEIPAVRAFVEKYIKRSEKFHELLRAPIINNPIKRIPLLHKQGTGTKTLEFARLRQDADRLTYDFKKSDAVDGDGTVTNVSGAPLAFFRVLDFVEVETKAGHLEALSLPDSQKIIQRFLLQK
jgi:pimeloyl-ACP methyl ester carboxylesterase